MRDGKCAGNPAAGIEQGKPLLQGIDAMTNHQIINEIEQLFSDNSNNLDIKQLEAYLDVLQERDPVTEDFDSDALWKELIDKNPSLFENTSEKQSPAEKPGRPIGRRLRFRRLVGSIAAAAALICMVTVMSSASFRTWIREAYEGSFVYRFFNSEEAPAALPDYEIIDLPEGYVLLKSENDGLTGMKLYAHDDMKLTFLYFQTDDGIFDLIPVGDSTYNCSTIRFDDVSVDFYFKTDVDAPNEMLWISEQEKIAFHLTGFFNFQEMLKMAESISIKE